MPPICTISIAILVLSKSLYRRNHTASTSMYGQKCNVVGLLQCNATLKTINKTGNSSPGVATRTYSAQGVKSPVS